MDPLTDIVLLAPQARMYGWGVIENRAEPSNAPFRAFQVVEPAQGPDNLGVVRPVEGGRERKASLITEYFVPVSSMPEYRAIVDRVTLTTTNALRIDGRVYSLFLGKRRFLEMWFSSSKASLRLNGLVHKRIYQISGWIVPHKVLRLKNVRGAYYVGLFEPADQPWSGESLALPWEHLTDWAGR